MAAQTPAPAPWEAVPAHHQLFVLITGANSGIGLGTAQVLIDDFLRSRPPASHLIVLPTTRSSRKSLETVRELRAYAVAAAKTWAQGRGPGPGCAWQDAVARVHILSLALDLCDLRAVRRLARTLRCGTVSNPDGLDGEYLRNVRIPRLDSVVCNAAYGGWSGMDYPRAARSLLARGLVQIATWPDFKLALPTCILNERPVYGYPDKPLLGEVFCACVFGHYMLARNLLPLLSRPGGAGLPPARIVWSSSVEAVQRVFDIDDMQCFERPEAYESAKRLTDLVCLTASLPATRPYTSRFFALDNDDGKDNGDNDDDSGAAVPPNMYLTHPGVVASTLFPLPWFLFGLYRLALEVCRWLGSPWHNVTGYRGAKAAAWVALQPQEALDHLAAQRVKWGSSTDARLRVHVKKTEVEGWGWDGSPETAQALQADCAVGVLRKAVGRKLGAAFTTADDLVEFEALGARCWNQLEELRAQWDEILDRDGP
ncbi:uncharacterized protein UV8b_05639 [Ustilaginoidea virens]|uniref:3-ketosteroid reductase n=1 Tax=Ustilaginoidea virens TaxID=1159556 RepID=A0A8E5MJ34_USTVR|nr:uncharacterized protein UV8b_05639 [Ustilaginoidea virens]QUC21396.1 hypothetical protein UV8b_05639 [Ustilaginoidea virens]